MTERPILMSAPMVRACLRQVSPKTQTRRIVAEVPPRTRRWLFNLERDGLYWPATNSDYTGSGIACPYGGIGNRLWVREAARLRSVGPGRGELTISYRADDDEVSGQVYGHTLARGEKNPFVFTRWTPSIHMPRWACRLVLEVTAVRVERLQQIGESDAKAEGVLPMYPPGNGPARHVYAYRHLWDSLNAKRGFGWHTNPWVWVIDFRRAEALKAAA